ncbi:hypothetical protein [Kribbella sp. NPDC051718]|uniref:hypothetical protein n=1 Tax=Kribbella sp. NPDC051718 TaxID=3155168 RepID=UPI0034422889
MAEQPRRRADSAVPDVGDGLWERIQAAVLAESGADKSLWNGELGYTDPAESVRGEAYGNGKLNLSEESVVRPLREMYEQRGQRVTEEQLIARRSAFQVVAHEFGHLAVPEEYQLADRLAEIHLKDFTPIEEGTNEAWSQAKTDALIDRALPRDLALQLKSVDTLRTYPGWDPAARAFADDLGAEIGLDGDEVLSVMNREARTGKARAAADLIFEHSELPRLVPPEHQAAVRLQLRGQLDKAFTELRPLNEDKTVNRRSVATKRGQAMAEVLVRTVQNAEERFRQGPGRGAEYELQAAFDDARVAVAMEDPEVARLRRMMGGQAPAAGAARPARGAESARRAGERPAGRSTEAPER